MFNKDAAEDEEPERRGIPREPTTIQRAAVRGDGRTSAGGTILCSESVAYCRITSTRSVICSFKQEGGLMPDGRVRVPRRDARITEIIQGHDENTSGCSVSEILHRAPLVIKVTTC